MTHSPRPCSKTTNWFIDKLSTRLILETLSEAPLTTTGVSERLFHSISWSETHTILSRLHSDQLVDAVADAGESWTISGKGLDFLKKHKSINADMQNRAVRLYGPIPERPISIEDTDITWPNAIASSF